MLCITNYCRFRTGTIWSHKRIQPHIISPVLTSVQPYSNPCGTSKSGSGRRGTPCGASGPNPPKSQIKTTYKPYVPLCFKDHDHKNMSLKRPMSPHLEIFTMTTPAAMSIIQRATGALLATYAILLAGGSLFLSNGVETYVSIIQSLNLGATSSLILKMLLGFPFLYHYFNGIRFCMWNTGRWLTMNEVNATAKQAMIAAVISTVFFAFL